MKKVVAVKARADYYLDLKFDDGSLRHFIGEHFSNKFFTRMISHFFSPTRFVRSCIWPDRGVF